MMKTAQFIKRQIRHFQTRSTIIQPARILNRRSLQILNKTEPLNKQVLTIQLTATSLLVLGTVYFFSSTTPSERATTPPIHSNTLNKDEVVRSDGTGIMPSTDPLKKFPELDREQVNILLQANQYSRDISPGLDMNPKTPLVRYETSSVASNTPSEDRHCEHAINKRLNFGVFDGHSGSACVDTVVANLTSYIAAHLDPPSTYFSYLSSLFPSTPSPTTSDNLIKAFIKLDADILKGTFTTQKDLMHAFIPAMSGACAVVAVVDADAIHVAWCGDSRALLCTPSSTTPFKVTPLTTDHTPRNPHEYERLIEQHPDELETVVMRGRVLGSLMPSRAFGDARYKYPRVVQEKILAYQNKTRNDGKIRGVSKYLKTPPYVTAEPEVRRVSRDSIEGGFIVLASDGLWDCATDEDVCRIVQGYIDNDLGGGVFENGDNCATHLIRNVFAGESGERRLTERVGRIMGVPAEKSRKYRDDVTVTVLFFGKEGVVESGGEKWPKTIEVDGRVLDVKVDKTKML